MRVNGSLLLILALSVLAAASPGVAQDKLKEQPPAKQSAPSESADAPGHDAQTGKPETAEKGAKQNQEKGKNGERANPQATPSK